MSHENEYVALQGHKLNFNNNSNVVKRDIFLACCIRICMYTFSWVGIFVLVCELTQTVR